MGKTLKSALLLGLLATALAGCSGGEDPASTNPGDAPGGRGQIASEGGPSKSAPTKAPAQGEGLAPGG